MFESFLTIAAIVVLFFLNVRRVTVFEYERALRYSKGTLDRLLGPGRHWFLPLQHKIQKVDIRPCVVSVPGQEVLSQDGVALKTSLVACYAIADPAAAINAVQDFRQALYTELQLALRRIIGQRPIEEVMASRAEIAGELVSLCHERAEELGLTLKQVEIKDIMFPGKLKEMFAQVVSARMEGLAALERARGETAALRHLANAAKLIESNPQLMPLRLVHALGESKGNTLVLGMPPYGAAVAGVAPQNHRTTEPPGPS